MENELKPSQYEILISKLQQEGRIQRFSDKYSNEEIRDIINELGLDVKQFLKTKTNSINPPIKNYES